MNGTAQLLLNESALVIEAASQPQAFAQIYDHYFPRVYTYVRYRVADGDVADDLTAVIFERALSQIHKYNAERAPFAAWLFGIARNIVNNHHRRQRRWQWFSLNHDDETHIDPTATPEDLVLHAERAADLVAAIGQLSSREQDVLALKFMSGLTNRYIAQLVGLSESNVNVIVYRALQKLRDILAKEDTHHE